MRIGPRAFLRSGLPVTANTGSPPPLPTAGDGAATAATAWAAAVVANGGSVSPARKTIVETFIAAEITAGTWDLTDDYWAQWGENALQSRTSLKQQRLAIEIAVPLWTIDRGYTFNGSTQYLSTGFIPSTHGVAMTTTNLRIASYERTNVDGGYTAGAHTDTTSSLTLRPNSAGEVQVNVNSATVSYTLPGANSSGFTAASRNGAGAAQCVAYKNGVALVQSGSAGFGAVMTASSLFIGARNAAGTPSNFRAASVGFVCVGGFLTPAQELAQYTNVQAWATAIGAQV